MSDSERGDVTQLLDRWSQGDQQAFDSVATLVHHELRKLADAYLRRERSDHTLQPTALVNELWLRLVRHDDAQFENRKRFFALAAQIMRQILVDHARSIKSAKRGGGAAPLPFNESTVYDPHNAEDFLILDDALRKLAAVQPRLARVIELRYFAGLGVAEVASLLDISIATVSRDQKLAEALLNQMMTMERN